MENCLQITACVDDTDDPHDAPSVINAIENEVWHAQDGPETRSQIIARWTGSWKICQC